MSTDCRARILQRALKQWPNIEAASRIDAPLSPYPYRRRLFEMRFGDGNDDVSIAEGYVTVDAQTGRIIATMAKAIIEGELRELRGLPIELPARPVDPAAEPRQPSPIAQLRALVATGLLDPFMEPGDNPMEVQAALELIPKVIAQMDAALAELRKVA